MSPPEPNYPATASSEHPNTAIAQENNLKINFMKMIKILKEKVNKSLLKI